MRPTVEYNRNPLDAEGLPSTKDIKLELRVETGPQLASHWTWPVILVSLAAFGSTFLLKLLSLHVSEIRFLVYAVFGFAVLALLNICLQSTEVLGYGADELAQPTRTMPSLRLFREWSIGRILAVVSALALVWLTTKFIGGVTSSLANRILFFFAAVVALALLADSLCTHHVAWLTASPFIDDSTKERIRTAWRRRFENPPELLSPAIRSTSLACVGDYRFGFLLLVGIVLLTLFIASFYSGPFTGMILVFAFTVQLLLVGILYAGFGTKPLRGLSEAYRSLVGWLTYDPGNSDAPGAFGSPLGTYGTRVSLYLFAIFVLGVSAASLAAYYPMSFLFGDRIAWAEMYEETWPLQEPTHVPDPTLSDADNQFLSKIDRDERDRFERLLLTQKVLEAKRLRTLAALKGLDRTPEAWLFAAFKGVLRFDSTFMLAILVSGIAAAVFVPLIAFGVSLLVAGRVLPLIAHELDQVETAAESTLSEWDAIVGTIQNSPCQVGDVRERDHLWLGYNAEHAYPVLLDRRILHEHAHIMGDSGSGKTALALAPMISQLIRLSGRLNASDGQPSPTSNPSDKVSILVIDLKGDRTLFHNTHLEAKRAGLPFRWFTNRREHATYGFNPFLQEHVQDALTVNQRTEVLLQALGLQYGEFYGAGYFSSINQTVLRRFLKKYSKEIRSFSQFAGMVESPADYQATFKNAGGRRQGFQRMREWKDATHLFARIEGLASLPALNLTAKNSPNPAMAANQIDMSQLLDRPSVVYFHLSSITETVAVQGIAKLALYSLLTAADLREPNTGARVYCFIDEFQQVAADNLELILRQARSKNVACILANQAITDLRTKDGNLMQTVEANTAFKQVFRASSYDSRDRLVKSSGETIYDLFADTESSDGRSSFSMREEIGPRFRQNDIIAASYEPNTSLVHVSKPSGLTRYGGQLFAVRSDFHIPEDEYRTREALPWPEPNDELGTFRAIDLETHWSEKSLQQASPPPPSNTSPEGSKTNKKPAQLDEAIQSFLQDFEEESDA